MYSIEVDYSAERWLIRRVEQPHRQGRVPGLWFAVEGPQNYGRVVALISDLQSLRVTPSQQHLLETGRVKAGGES